MYTAHFTPPINYFQNFRIRLSTVPCVHSLEQRQIFDVVLTEAGLAFGLCVEAAVAASGVRAELAGSAGVVRVLTGGSTQRRPGGHRNLRSVCSQLHTIRKITVYFQKNYYL